jgi:hypothetical protein
MFARPEVTAWRTGVCLRFRAVGLCVQDLKVQGSNTIGVWTVVGFLGGVSLQYGYK